MDDVRSRLAAILARCDAGAISPAVAIMEMLIATEDRLAVSTFLGAREASPSGRALSALLDLHADGCGRIAAMLHSDVDSPPRGATVEEGIAFCARLFDWSVRQSEEASVALYSLGSPAVLESATREIVAALAGWGILGRGGHALDVGCGIGRMEVALAPHFDRIDAIDVSPGMLDVARRRCAGLANVILSLSGGRDLAAFADGVFDLVLAVDSFPYLVQSGDALAAAHVAEAARVLRPGGELVILNFSYRDDPAADERDADGMARAAGLDVILCGARPFALWNGSAFRLRKEGREVRESVTGGAWP